VSDWYEEGGGGGGHLHVHEEVARGSALVTRLAFVRDAQLHLRRDARRNLHLLHRVVLHTPAATAGVARVVDGHSLPPARPTRAMHLRAETAFREPKVLGSSFPILSPHPCNARRISTLEGQPRHLEPMPLCPPPPPPSPYYPDKSRPSPHTKWTRCVPGRSPCRSARSRPSHDTWSTCAASSRASRLREGRGVSD